MSPDPAALASEKIGAAPAPSLLLDREADFEEQKKVVLHDWQLYHAGKEG
jgi:hypothetical protein